MRGARWLAGAGGAVVVAVALWAAPWKKETRPMGVEAAQALDLPVTMVKRGDVAITVAARGELQGSNSEMLVGPMTGARELIITQLKASGTLVNPGEVVAQFDTTDQEFALAEAEADLAEADQQVLQAESEAAAKEEETSASLLQARSDLKVAELEARKNPLLAQIIARQNTLAVSAARDRLQQLEQDLTNRKATSRASVMIQQAARSKAEVKAATARRNIELMTLKAKSRGYVNVQQNQNSNFMFWGMSLPAFKVGDTARPGMAVAQIPDLNSWEIRAAISELDRGHLAAGQPAEITVVAMPERQFKAKIKDIGGTDGPPWDRKFQCVFALMDPVPELRPGMSTRVVVTTSVLKDVLWLPSQALFESDGRKFVYLRSGGSFVTHDVQLVRRGESQVVITGLQAGQVVSMASPDQASKKKDADSKTGAMKALKGA